VLTNEAIEVHLSYLRPAVEGLVQKLDQVAKESVARDEMLASKIDRLDEALTAKIDKLDEALTAKIDKVGEKLESTRQDLSERFSKIEGSIDGLKWFIASIAVILSGLSIGHNLGWI